MNHTPSAEVSAKSGSQLLGICGSALPNSLPDSQLVTQSNENSATDCSSYTPVGKQPSRSREPLCTLAHILRHVLPQDQILHAKHHAGKTICLLLDEDFHLLREVQTGYRGHHIYPRSSEILAIALKVGATFVAIVQLGQGVNRYRKTLATGGPTRAGFEFAIQTAAAFKIQGIILMDHVIVQQDAVFSFRQHGLLS